MKSLTRLYLVGSLAVVSVIALLLLDFGSISSQDNADTMITSAVLSRAGAIATPSEKPTDIAAPETITVSERPGR